MPPCAWSVEREGGPPDEPQPELSVSARQSRAAWARLIKKVYEADPLSCPKCSTDYVWR